MEEKIFKNFTKRKKIIIILIILGFILLLCLVLSILRNSINKEQFGDDFGYPQNVNIEKLNGASFYGFDVLYFCKRINQKQYKLPNDFKIIIKKHDNIKKYNTTQIKYIIDTDLVKSTEHYVINMHCKKGTLHQVEFTQVDNENN